MTERPTHWDGRRWLFWDGQAWVPVPDAATAPVPGTAATRPHSGHGPLFVIIGVIVVALLCAMLSILVVTLRGDSTPTANPAPVDPTSAPFASPSSAVPSASPSGAPPSVTATDPGTTPPPTPDGNDPKGDGPVAPPAIATGTQAHVSVVAGYLDALLDGLPGRAAQYCTDWFAEQPGGPYASVEDRGALLSYDIRRSEPADSAVAVTVRTEWESGAAELTYYVTDWGDPLLIDAMDEAGVPAGDGGDQV